MGADLALAARTLALDLATAEAVRALDEAGIDSMVLKGPATVLRLYGDAPDRRNYGDIDLAVDPRRFHDAGRVLADLGYTDSHIGIRSSEAARSQERPWRRDGHTPVAVDLHRGFHHVADWPAWWEMLTCHRDELVIEGRAITIPDPVASALIVALHASKASSQRKAVEDLRRALAEFDEQVWRQAAVLAASFDATAAFAAALCRQPDGALLAARLGLSVTDPVAWLRATALAQGVGSLSLVLAPGTRAARARRLRDAIAPSKVILAGSRPIALRGRGGLLLAHLDRLGLILTRLPPLLLAWRRATCAVRPVAANPAVRPGAATADEMATFVGASPAAGTTDPRTAPAIEVCGLTRRFGGRIVLDRLDLSIGVGERVGLWGPNGSGKTTLLRCLVGTLTSSAGQAQILGEASGSVAARSTLGASLGQERAFYARLSGRENLLFTARLRMPAPSAAGAVTAICDELGLDGFVDTPVERYSSGMRARLAVARALVGEPGVVLLDEPTRSLDEAATGLVWAALDRRPDVTVVVASPRLEDLSRCTRVIDLVDTPASHAALRARTVNPSPCRPGPAPATPARPAPPPPGAAAAVLSLVRRDLAQRRVVKFALILDLVFGALNLIVYKFIGRLMHASTSEAVGRAGGYFSFAAVGIAFFLVIQTATTGITRQVRDEVRSGTLEQTVGQPIGTGSLAVGIAGFPFLFATSRALVYLVLAALLGMDVTHADWAGVVVMLVVAAPALAAIGIVLAAVAMVVERGDVVGRFVAYGLGFASGAYFPVSEFSAPVRAVSAALPTRVALDGLRAALDGASWWTSAGTLAGLDLVTLPVAVAIFAGSLRWARRNGRLTRG